MVRGLGVAVGTGVKVGSGVGVGAGVSVGIRVGVGSGVVVGMVWVANVVAVGPGGSRVGDGGASPWVQAAAINPNRTTRQATKVAFKADPVSRGGG